jgi:predicted secreted protein
MKYSAFGTKFKLGIRQIETATVLGAITGSGNATVIVTATGMTGTPITTSVAVLNLDTADTVAEKIRTALNAVANITAKFIVGGSGAQVVLTRLIAAANISNLNISIANGTCTGLTAAPTSVDTLGGVVSTEIAAVRNISGPGISVDTEDVTTHDSIEAWEELVATIIRTGNVGLDLIFDPNAATHSADAGLLNYIENRLLGYCDLVFPDTTVWSFPAYITGFEPGEPHDGALTASVGVKISGKPILV